ncbi:hypothetical protein F8154_04825 [Alkaliphilus pronyensis]|uniref:Transcriptional regulator n=1 Tax=Alkaliphilus pronyensis TaxID=1482732 RepID=A0A6I0FBY6_9FIRM|nr:DUF6144 family protein [Alkaliphilus pronyensis]KAB3536086.1 hypothetical protein F8154_04825 [Alkaliphilus pronyensis]
MEANETRNWINNVLSEISNLNDDEGEKILEKCGRSCCSLSNAPQLAKEIRSKVIDKDDINLLFETYKREVYKNSPRLYKENDTIYQEFHKCGCPMVETIKNLDPFLCNCTKGYSKAIFEALFDRQVDVQILESILRGNKICKLAVKVV